MLLNFSRSCFRTQTSLKNLHVVIPRLQPLYRKLLPLTINNPYSVTCQVSDENLGIGTDTWARLAVYEQEEDPKPFYLVVRKFYLPTIKKMLKKFPFGDSMLKDMGH